VAKGTAPPIFSLPTKNVGVSVTPLAMPSCKSLSTMLAFSPESKHVL